jgi:hypothetical protein
VLEARATRFLNIVQSYQLRLDSFHDPPIDLKPYRRDLPVVVLQTRWKIEVP